MCVNMFMYISYFYGWCSLVDAVSLSLLCGSTLGWSLAKKIQDDAKKMMIHKCMQQSRSKKIKTLNKLKEELSANGHFEEKLVLFAIDFIRIFFFFFFFSMGFVYLQFLRFNLHFKNGKFIFNAYCEY